LIKTNSPDREVPPVMSDLKGNGVLKVKEGSGATEDRKVNRVLRVLKAKPVRKVKEGSGATGVHRVHRVNRVSPVSWHHPKVCLPCRETKTATFGRTTMTLTPHRNLKWMKKITSIY